MSEQAPAVAGPASGRGLARTGAVLAAATLLGNVFGYLLVVAVSRLLAPADYGAVGALLNLAVIGLVPALAVQLVAARETARASAERRAPPVPAGTPAEAPAEPPAEPPGDLRLGGVGLAVGAAAGVLAVAAAPLLDRYLHLGGPWAAVALGLSLLPLAGTAAAQGVVQGAQQFRRLSLLLIIAGATRFAGGAGAAAAGWGVSGVMVGTTIGAFVTLAVAVAVVPGAFGVPPLAGLAALGRDVLGSSTSTAGLLVFVNLDVLLARHTLPAAASGLYAVGSLFAKVTFWGPAFLATLLYPRMAAPAGRNRAVLAAVALTAALGGAVVLVTAAAGGGLVGLFAGARYAELGRTVALFAALGTAFAVAQVLIYARVAVVDRRLGVACWVLAAATVGAVQLEQPRTVTALVATVLAGAVALVVVGLAMERGAVAGVLRRRAAERPARRAPVGS